MSCNLILLLHAHLPYIRHPEYEYALEENWLFEAIRDTYIPLLDILERMVDDGISPGLTVSLSPTLMEMLNDDLLRDRFVHHMDNLIELSGAEKQRTKGSVFESAAFLYDGKFREVRRLYLERYGKDLISPFRRLQDEGHIEIAATAATHAFLPAFANYPGAVKRQIEVGIRSYARNLGRRPAGFWLPECGYFEGLDSFLKDAGIQYCFLEAHGLIHGRPRPRHSIYKPVLSSEGVLLFGRDFKSARQVWCASRGYPGDPAYRDFYRDIGFDLPAGYIGRFTGFEGIRTFTGMKYYRVTGKTEQKLPYDRAAAMSRMSVHAGHFAESRRSDFERLSGYVPEPLIFSAFDAELFGHWWFEGIEWLDTVVREISGSATGAFGLVTPSRYLGSFTGRGADAGGPPVHPAPSSWGEGGYNSLWIGEKNHYLYRRLHGVMERLEAVIAQLKQGAAPEGLIRRAMNQAVRETLLAQASDWFFLMEKGRAPEYAEKRVTGHIGNVTSILVMLEQNRVDALSLKKMETSNRAFAWLDTAGDYWPLPSDSKSS